MLMKSHLVEMLNKATIIIIIIIITTTIIERNFWILEADSFFIEMKLF